MSLKYAYKVVAQIPPGSDASGWEPDGWHAWCFGHGYAEASQCVGYEAGDDPRGRDHLPFRWPRKVHFWNRTAAQKTADRFRRWGATAEVVRSEPITWEAVSTDEQRGYRALEKIREQARLAGWVEVPRGSGIAELAEDFCPDHAAGKGGGDA